MPLQGLDLAALCRLADNTDAASAPNGSHPYAGQLRYTHLVLHQGCSKHGLAARCCAGVQDPFSRLRVQHQHHKPCSLILHLQASIPANQRQPCPGPTQGLTGVMHCLDCFTQFVYQHSWEQHWLRPAGGGLSQTKASHATAVCTWLCAPRTLVFRTCCSPSCTRMKWRGR